MDDMNNVIFGKAFPKEFFVLDFNEKPTILFDRRFYGKLEFYYKSENDYEYIYSVIITDTLFNKRAIVDDVKLRKSWITNEFVPYILEKVERKFFETMTKYQADTLWRDIGDKSETHSQRQQQSKISERLKELQERIRERAARIREREEQKIREWAERKRKERKQQQQEQQQQEQQQSDIRHEDIARERTSDLMDLPE